MKQCTKCRENKELREYYKHHTNTDGRNSWCKLCFKQSQKRNWNSNPKTKIKWQNKWGSGVYGIFEFGECLYVGESGILAARISNHKCFNSQISNHLKDHPAFVIGIIEKTLNHKEREKHWIDKFNPLYSD